MNMEEKTSISKWEKKGVSGGLFLLLAGILFYNPYVWRFHSLGEYTFISRGCLALGAAALLLLFPERCLEKAGRLSGKFLLLSALLFFYTLIQFVRLKGVGGWEVLGEMELFLLLPFFSLVFAGEIRRFAGKVFALLGLWQLCLCAYHTPFLQESANFSFWRADWTLFMAGITGNANWTSSLLILTVPFLLFHLHCFSRKKKLPAAAEGIFLAIPVLSAGYFLYKLQSMGSLLAFGASVGILLVILSGKHCRKYLLSGGVLLLLLIAFFLFLPGKESSLQKAGNSRTRLELFLAGASAIMENPLAGSGNEGTAEGILTRNRSEGYFLTPNAAARTNHPHNEIFMRMLLSGIIGGLLYWGFFIFFPLWATGKKWSSQPAFSPIRSGRQEQEKLLYFWALLFLIFHGQIDLALFAWPLREISLILLGVFWAETFCGNPAEEASYSLAKPWKAVFVAAGVLLLTLSGLAAGRNFISMQALRKLDYDRSSSFREKIEEGKRAALLTPQNGLLLYRFTTCCIRQKCWQDALFFAERFPFTFQKDFGRNHGFRGQILARLGKWEEAFSAFQKDAELFPLAVIPVFNMIQIAVPAGKKEVLVLLHQELERRKKIMGFTAEDMKKILFHGENELRPGKNDFSCAP